MPVTRMRQAEEPVREQTGIYLYWREPAKTSVCPRWILSSMIWQLLIRDGLLYRLALTDIDGTPAVSDARVLVNLSGETFRNLAAPKAAEDWFADVPLDEATLWIR